MRLRPDTKQRIAQAQDLAAHGLRTIYADQVRAPRPERAPDFARTPALLRAGRYLAQPPPRRRTRGKPAPPARPARHRRLTSAQARRLCRKDYIGAPDRAGFIADITAQALAEHARADRNAKRRAAAAAKRATERGERFTVIYDSPAASAPAHVPDPHPAGTARPGDPAPGRRHKRPRSTRKARR